LSLKDTVSACGFYVSGITWLSGFEANLSLDSKPDSHKKIRKSREIWGTNQRVAALAND
jgi:hypothetical protein